MRRTVTSTSTAGGFESLGQRELHDLADGLTTDGPISQDPAVIARCIEFICAETRGNWHGRARAMMCRRLKYCMVRPEQRDQLVGCITGRLGEGNFSEQFKDQLRLAICLDRQRTFAAARRFLAESPKGYVRRFCLWTLAHDQ